MNLNDQVDEYVQCVAILIVMLGEIKLLTIPMIVSHLTRSVVLLISSTKYSCTMAKHSVVTFLLFVLC